MLAAGGAQGEQALFDLLLLSRIKLGRAQGLFQRVTGLFDRQKRLIQRLGGRTGQIRGLLGTAIQPSLGGR